MFSTEHIINFFHFEITRNLVKKIVFQCFIFVWQYHSCSDLFLQGQELVTGDIPCNEKTSVVNDKLQTLLFSLSNSRRHSANADVIADVKSKIIVSRQHFFADVIFSATSKVQNYQNKTGEKSLYPSKYMLTTYFKKFQRFKYISFILSLANCKQLRMCNRLYRSRLSAMFFLVDIRSNQFRVYLII